MVTALSERMGVGGDAQGRVVWADIRWTGRDAPSQSGLPEEFRVIVDRWSGPEWASAVTVMP